MCGKHFAWVKVDLRELLMIFFRITTFIWSRTYRNSKLFWRTIIEFICNYSICRDWIITCNYRCDWLEFSHWNWIISWCLIFSGRSTQFPSVFFVVCFSILNIKYFLFSFSNKTMFCDLILNVCSYLCFDMTTQSKRKRKEDKQKIV